MRALMQEIFGGLPRQGPGSDAYTRRALHAAGLHERDTAWLLDVGCGSGASTTVLARALPADIVAVDLDLRLLARLRDSVRSPNVRGGVACVVADMAALPFADGSFDGIWSEGAIYIVGFAEGLAGWRRLLRPGGVIAATELSWLTEDPPAEAADFWSTAYPAMATIPANIATATAAGYRVREPLALGPDAFWPEFYDPLEARLAELRSVYPEQSPARELLDFVQHEIDVYRAHGATYAYVFYICELAA